MRARRATRGRLQRKKKKKTLPACLFPLLFALLQQRSQVARRLEEDRLLPRPLDGGDGDDGSRGVDGGGQVGVAQEGEGGKMMVA